MKFFGWTWIAAAFSNDDIGQSGRYAFTQFTNSESGLYFPCFYIVGTQNEAVLNALTSCLHNNTNVRVLLLWGSTDYVVNSLTYLYTKTNITYLTFVINPNAAISINFNLFKVPASFYQGSIFLSENYDESTGYDDCINRFINDPSDFNENVRKLYEFEYGCVITKDKSIPFCKKPVPDKDEGQCRCLIEDFDYISKPYTVKHMNNIIQELNSYFI